MSLAESRPSEEAACSPAELDELLEKTSRTFALAIPLLPEPTRRQVGLAYLLFRIADTFEDAELWRRDRKLAALRGFAALLDDGATVEDAAREAAGWLSAPPCRHAGYLELLRRAPEVLAAFHQLGAAPRRLIGEHTRRTAEGMARFVEAAGEDGAVELHDLAELQRYCYVVAGIVGEMLTELFLLGLGIGLGLGRRALSPVARYLRERSARFGEALQLVNILKDSAADAVHGRRFLPAGCAPAEVSALARGDIAAATEYVLALQEEGAPRGIVAFVALPVRLARATLDLFDAQGPGAKLGRAEVYGLAVDLERALDEGLPAL
jgi:farnesyl-diphosphate farnesyltransferase